MTASSSTTVTHHEVSLLPRRKDYKSGFVTGLVLFSAGCFLFWPAAQSDHYATFLLALFVIATGLAFLETAANPFIAQLRPNSSSEAHLNLAEAFNPVGAFRVGGPCRHLRYQLLHVDHVPHDLRHGSQRSWSKYQPRRFFIVMTIFGGAVGKPLMGLLAEQTHNTAQSYSLPCLDILLSGSSRYT